MTDAIPIRVLSFNILAECYVGSFYKINPKDVMKSSAREDAVLSELERYSPDVIALQEVEEAFWNNKLKTALEKNGYKGIIDMKKCEKVDGLVTMWKDDRFYMIDRKCVIQPKSQGEYARGQVSSVVTLVGHDSKKDPVPFIIASTHLLYNPKRGDIKLMQLSKLLDETYKSKKRCEDSQNIIPALIICGDFNFCPQSPLYTFMIERQIEFAHYEPKKLSGQYLMEIHDFYKIDQDGHNGLGGTLPVISHDMRCREKNVSDDMRCRKNHASDDMAYCGNRLSNKMVWSKAKEHFDNKTVTRWYHEDNPEVILRHPMQLKSAYSTKHSCFPYVSEPAYTGYHSTQKGVVDYIFYDHTGLEVLQLLEMPDMHEIIRAGEMPNTMWPPSDHLSLIVDFQYVTKDELSEIEEYVTKDELSEIEEYVTKDELSEIEEGQLESEEGLDPIT
eukprot:GHVL01036393.1.p1 GENE.GHVL01036393.1~~GHVL01036393.1.p1  ORF type:complete len:445 (-),score=87.69 GHVL01036393.1:96-1430(-)